MRADKHIAIGHVHPYTIWQRGKTTPMYAGYTGHTIPLPEGGHTHLFICPALPPHQQALANTVNPAIPLGNGKHVHGRTMLNWPVVDGTPQVVEVVTKAQVDVAHLRRPSSDKA